MKGDFPGVHKLGIGVVDVADLHLRALEKADAAGERFLAVSEYRTMKDISFYFGEKLSEYAQKLLKRELP